MPRKIVIFTVFLVVMATFKGALADPQRPLTCYDGKRSPFAATEMEQFEFLLGSFNSTIYPWNKEAGGWANEPTVRAVWEGEYILGGTAIADYWYVSNPTENPDADRGVNTRVYNPETKEWNMNWNTWGSNPQTTILKAKMIDGVLTMWQTAPVPNQKLISEFVVDTNDHWTRFTYIEIEDQRYPIFKIESYRNPCED